MSQLTAHIVYATFKALDDGQKEAFVQLIEEEKKRYQRPKRKNKRSNLPEKYQDIEKLAAIISSR